MYGRKARMAEIVQKVIHGGRPPLNTGKKVEHLKSVVLMGLKEQDRTRSGTVVSKPDPTKNVENTTIRKIIDLWKPKRHVSVVHLRSLRIFRGTFVLICDVKKVETWHIPNESGKTLGNYGHRG